MAQCQMCSGSGLMGAPPVRCLYCEGTGQTRRDSLLNFARAIYWIAAIILLGGVLSFWGYRSHRDGLEI